MQWKKKKFFIFVDNNRGTYGMIRFDTKAQAQQIIDGILVKKDWSERRALAGSGYYEPTWEKC